MKALSISVLLLLLGCIFNCQHSYAQTQQDTTQYHIKTNDGNEYIGSIVRGDSITTTFFTENLGEITIFIRDIKKLDKVKPHQIKEGQYWFENLHSTRHFWAPNGYGLKGGEGYYQNVWILFNQFSTGITDNISLGVGIVPVFLLGGDETPVWITPKISIPLIKNKVNIGGGALLGTVLGEENSNYGIVYGLSTFGSRDNNITAGLGWGYINDDFADKPIVNVNALARVGPRGYFITENYYFPGHGEDLVMISLGGRSLIKNVGLDYCLFMPFSREMDSFVAMPWLGLIIPFGN